MILAVALNRAWRDLRFPWVIVLWPVYSLMMAVVVVAAIMQELRGGPAPWNKLDRSGVISGSAARQHAGLACTGDSGT